MRLLNDSQMKTVADAIAIVEKNTDAELIAVLARQSDLYRPISTLWAAVIALILPVVLMQFPMALHPWHWLLIQWLVFLVMAVVLRWSPLLFRLCPKPLQHWRASNLAQRQFLQQNLHRTHSETGVLIFVSEKERYVEIIADRGISRHVTNAEWKIIIDQLTRRIKEGKTLEGFLEGIQRCGELLKTHVPATFSKNELPNHLIVIDRDSGFSI